MGMLYPFREHSMNSGELAKGVASVTGMSEANAKAAISAVFDQIADAAAKGEEVSISGFGKFAVKDRPERQGRNPATGEAMTIAASKKVSFTAAKGLKDKL
jgi:DNA-binding protein HU-beta